jgi:hypothetical protein
MLKKMYPFLLTALSVVGCNGGGNSNQTIGIYVTPYYNSQPLTINVGEYSQQLETSNPKQLLKLSDEIRKKVDEVNIETLYVLCIRLYDAGEKDEAAYWYYTAQFRKNVLISMQDGDKGGLGSPAFEIPHALQSFKDLSGKWINGYSYGKPEQLVQILQRVIRECSQMGYIQRAYPFLQFKPEEDQAAFISEQVEPIEEHCQWIIENKDDILRQRKENGMEGMY